MAETERIPMWKNLDQVLSLGNRAPFDRSLQALLRAEKTRVISRLNDKDRSGLQRVFFPVEAAGGVHDLPDIQAADIIRNVPSYEASSLSLASQTPCCLLCNACKEVDSAANYGYEQESLYDQSTFRRTRV